MAGLFSRLKNWIKNEEITADDLNAEFDNIIDNLSPENIGPYSTDVPKLQETFDPGDVGSENFPETTMEEIQANRSMIQKITGKDEWYIPPAVSLESLALSLGQGVASNRIISCAVDSNKQPQFLVAPVSGFTLTLAGLLTPFRFSANSVEVQISSNVTLDMTAAAGPTGAAAVAAWDDSVNSGTITQLLGEWKQTYIRINTVGIGTGWTARDGKLSAFKFTNGGSTEIFLGVYTLGYAGPTIVNCKRGFFFNSSGLNGRVTLGAAQSISICQLSYIFAKTDGTIFRNSSGNDPIVSGTQPATPVNGDLWFDSVNGYWKQYNGTSFIDAEATMVGLSVQDDTKVIATRSFDLTRSYSEICELNPIVSEVTASNIIKTSSPGGMVSVYGVMQDYYKYRTQWDLATDLDTGSVAASTKYYLYLTSDFVPKISLTEPHDRNYDLRGYYHPSKPWRSVGSFYTNGSSLAIVTMPPVATFSGAQKGSITSEFLAPIIGTSAIGISAASQNYPIGQSAQMTIALTNASQTSSDLLFYSSGRPAIVDIFPVTSTDYFHVDNTDVSMIVEYKSVYSGSYTQAEDHPHYSIGVNFRVPSSWTVKIFGLIPGQYHVRVRLVFRSGTIGNLSGNVRVYEM